MGSLTDLARRDGQRHAPAPQAKAATIRSTPATETDPVFVSIDLQGPIRRGPCFGWAPRQTVVQPHTEGMTDVPLQVTPRFPAPGDQALVMETNDGQLVIVTWWPDA